jgi:hypothetical protein
MSEKVFALNQSNRKQIKQVVYYCTEWSKESYVIGIVFVIKQTNSWQKQKVS